MSRKRLQPGPREGLVTMLDEIGSTLQSLGSLAEFSFTEFDLGDNNTQEFGRNDTGKVSIYGRFLSGPYINQGTYFEDAFAGRLLRYDAATKRLTVVPLDQAQVILLSEAEGRDNRVGAQFGELLTALRKLRDQRLARGTATAVDSSAVEELMGT